MENSTDKLEAGWLPKPGDKIGVGQFGAMWTYANDAVRVVIGGLTFRMSIATIEQAIKMSGLIFTVKEGRVHRQLINPEKPNG